MKIVSDLHLGATRKAGTTPATQVALRDHLQQTFRDLLCGDDHIVCNGDLFDNFSVEPTEVVRAFNSVADWLRTSPRHRG